MLTYTDEITAFTDADGLPAVRVEKLSDFLVSQIFDCGQCVRFEPTSDGSFEGVAHGRYIRFSQPDSSTLEIHNSTPADYENIWKRYLSLDADYKAVRADIASRFDIASHGKDTIMPTAMEYGSGIRILRQEPWETLCSFIVSQNNNIPRIKKIIAAMSERYGEPIYGGERTYYAFPTAAALVDAGVDGFKLDECDSSDNTGSWSFPLTSEFPSGLDGEQYHSLFGTLYCQTIMQALGDTKTLSEVRNLGALASSYPFVIYSDLYDHKDFIRGVAQSGFSGILWTPEVRDAKSKEELIRRLQAVVFSSQCLINAWYCEKAPWAQLDCEDEVRGLLKLRESLVPMLKKSFDLYRDTGKPPVRGLVMDYTDDPETFNIDDEYMFCEDLLVAPIAANTGDEREVYLPVADEWVDYFTGEKVQSGRIKVNTKGIPVYRRVVR